MFVGEGVLYSEVPCLREQGVSVQWGPMSGGGGRRVLYSEGNTWDPLSHYGQNDWLTTENTAFSQLRWRVVKIGEIKIVTRLHSSRMPTARALTVSPSMLCAGGCLVRGGVWSGGLVCEGCAWSGRVPARGGVVSQHALRQTPLWTESHMRVKT